MSDKSGIASQVISLPQGGGALAGIGESFAPELFTGTGNLTVPLALPPGRNGFAPSLRLTYSTGNGNGPFGLGWDLDLPQINRKTTKGVPRYRDSTTDPVQRDIFLLAGADDLVPTDQPAPGVTRFYPRTEGRFARIEHLRTAEQDMWRVRDRDGSVSLFGGVAVAGGEAATVADPAARSRVYAWKLTQTSDPFGNRIQYQYLRDSGQVGPRAWDQLYLEQVRYVDYDQDDQDRFLVSVSFVYDERPDAFSTHRAGFEVRTRLRCRRIEVRTHPHPDPDILVRTYKLTYADERVHAGELDRSVLPANRVSLLNQLRTVGHDGEQTEQLPPLEFGYSQFQPTGTRFRPLTGIGDQLPARSLADGDFELVDLSGNGLPDLMQMDGEVLFWRNLGGGRFDRPALMPEVPAGVQLRDPGVRLGDFNGDGRADLLVQHLGGYFPLSFQGRWSRQGFVAYQQQPSMPLGAPEVRLVDLDGDGVVDALRTGAAFELFFNDPGTGWGEVETRERGSLETFPDLSFADPRVKLADLTGDGLQDIVLVQQGSIDYWPYLGRGRWGPRVSMAHSPVFDDDTAPPALGFEPRRVLLGDVDGDGLDDLVYVQPDRITLWINQGGNRWSDPITLDAPPPVLADVDAVRLADMLGVGTAGVLWTVDQVSPADETYQFLDLTGGTKPYLLERIDNHRGAVTQVGYAPSTRFYLDDQADPATRWTTPLPFPVQVVEQVEAIDLLSGGKLTSQYRYHHGYWDGAEREFRGFGMVEQLDSETFQRYHQPGLHGQQTPFTPVEQVHFSPPTLTKTWFHLGPVGEESGERHEADFSGEYWPDDPPTLGPTAIPEGLAASAQADALRALRGSVLRTELYGLDGSPLQARPYSITESQFGLREEAPPAPGQAHRRRIFFPHQLASRTTQWERGEEPLARFAFTDDYDQFGQPRTHIQIACPRDWQDAASRSNAYLASATQHTYATRDDDRYLVDRPATVTVFEIIQGDDQPRRTVAELRQAIGDGTAARGVIDQAVHHYDGEPFSGLPAGQIGEFGALVRSERLVLTEELLREAYASPGLGAPVYLAPDRPPDWTDEYPLAFRDRFPPLAGYTFLPGDPAHEPGYFAQTTRRRYDLHNGRGRPRGLVETTRDPLGRDTTIAYDRFGLFAGEVVDPVGLATGAVHDYRAFRPSLVTDANGNRSAFAFSPLGLLERSAVMGRQDEHLGDTLEVPGTRLVYDFLAFADSPADQRQPISVRTIRRVHHATNVEVPPSERDETLEMVEFSDGYGRLIQTRTQAEDMRFGDPVSGGSVLPAAQDDPATGQPVIGQRNNDPQQPNVVVSGWQVHDNKGRVVERYEPFFATGWQFSVPTGPQLRQRVRSFYDPRGRVLRSVNPDGSQQRAVYGIPIELADPERFSPTPWEAFTYDPNDNAGRTHEDDARPYQDHWDTPSTVVIDALDRVVLRVERTRQPRAAPSDPPAPILELQTHHAYDIRGKLVRVTDALGRLAARHVYDLADRVLRTESIDAGVRCSVLDAAGNQIEQRDSKGALVLHAVDLLNRPSRLWARDSDQAVVTLRERLEYGDGGDPGQPAQQRAANRADNLLGRLHQHYDEAGLVIFARHDFKGNVLEKVRQVISDDTLMTVFPSSDDPAPDWRLSPFRVDWEPPTGTSLRAHAALLLDPAVYETSAVYDALNRVTVIRYPRDVDGGRKELQATYSRAGAVDRLQLDDVVFVDRVVYNAAGRRTLIAFGDGVMTRYAYEPQTFRLQRLRSERYLKPPEDTVTYRPTGAPLQDLAYRYDLAANLLSIVDRTPGCGVRANPDATSITDPGLRALVAAGGALLRRFTYDPLYRLVAATGRECTDGGQIQPWAEGARCGFNSASHGTPNQDNAPDLTHAYRQRYDYDPVGNLVRLGHDADASASSRTFGLAAGTNRLQTLTVGATEFQYAHDANGNLVGETSSRHLDWDHADRLKAFRTQAGTSEPSVHVQYLYDGDGQRVKCLRRLQGGGFEATTSIDGLFEHRRWRLDSRSAGANDYLHVLDNQDRIAVARVGAPHPDDKGPTVQYHLSDHLGTSTVVLDDNNGFINREEYTPYGETTFGGYARKRYRFTGTERDEDSGLCYHGARYFAPWLGRWTSPDPAGLADGPNPYRYARDNPMSMRDPTGYQAAPPPQTPQPASPPDPASSAAGADVSLAELLAWPRSTYLITAEQSHEAETSQPLTATTPLIVETDPEACCAELMANVRANLDQQAQAEQQRREFEQLGPILGAGDFVLKLWGASAVIGAAGGLAAAGAGAALVAAAQSAVGALSGAAQTAGIWTAVTFPRLTAGGMALLTALSGEGGPTGPAGQSTGQAGGAAAGVVPDVFTYRLLRLPVVATATGRGITQAVRQRLVAFFYKYGGKGPVDIAHNFGQEFVFLRSGASALVGAEMRSINRAEGSAISAAASLWRALNEQLPESLRRFVRPVGGQ